MKDFEPGLLAKLNRGILHADEVNLLDEHFVYVLLDSVSSDWSTVEREGISVRRPFRNIGTRSITENYFEKHVLLFYYRE